MNLLFAMGHFFPKKLKLNVKFWQKKVIKHSHMIVGHGKQAGCSALEMCSCDTEGHQNFGTRLQEPFVGSTVTLNGH